MSHHTQVTASTPADATAATPKSRSIARLFGHKTSRRLPVSIETDAKLRASHVRAAAFRPELY